jgi:hypothetical protein
MVFIGRVADEPIAVVKTGVIIDAGLKRIKEVLDDVAGRVKRVPHLPESRILQELTPAEKLRYDRLAAPWPAADRDIAYRGTAPHESGHGIVCIMKSEPVSSLPEQKGVVRAQLLESSDALTALNERQTRVELIVHADPPGLAALVDREYHPSCMPLPDAGESAGAGDGIAVGRFSFQVRPIKK